MAKRPNKLGAGLAVGALVALTIVGVFLRRVVPPAARRPAVAVVPVVAKSLGDLGPRLVSNQTSTPLFVTGQSLSAGDKLLVEQPGQAPLEVKLVEADGSHGWARLPPIDLPAGQSEADLHVTLRAFDQGPGAPSAPGQARLTVVNDAHFPDPIGVAFAQGRACAISSTTDALVCINVGEGVAANQKTVPLADGPTAIVATGDGFLVGFDFTRELWSLDAATLKATVLVGPRGVTGLAYDAASGTVYVAEHLGNTVSALNLRDAAKVLWTTPVDPGTGKVAIAGDAVAVGSKQTGEVQLLNRRDGKLVATLSPGPGLPIVGGHTAAFSHRIDGGLPVRDLVYSAKAKRLFVASSGPNIGPNPERMEVAMNGGVTVIDPAKRTVLYHLGFGAGVTESLALDEGRGLLYASDVAIGVVRVLDVRRLASLAPKTSQPGLEGTRALLATIVIPPPAGFPEILPASELGVKGRAGVELHSGPKALALSDTGALLALNRFSGTLARFTVPKGSVPALAAQTVLFDVLGQPERKKGQVLYYTDVARTGMSCDSCHVDGHVGGLLFSKTRPIRLYRATSIRGSRETPPYFIPASEQSLASTASFVGSRNRFQNPAMSPDEIALLGKFSAQVPTPPNPFVTADGALPPELRLPDGASGHPRVGADLFFGKAACQACHPGPLFTTDQSPATRGRYLAVGTPALFPLRPEMQDGVHPQFPAQSLTGIWDLFPLTTTGIAGFAVENEKLVVATRFPLRAVLDARGPIPHGNAAGLSKDEENDLLAFLMTL